MSAFDRRLLWVGIAGAIVVALAASVMGHDPHPGTRSAVMAEAKTVGRAQEGELPTVVIMARRETRRHDR